MLLRPRNIQCSHLPVKEKQLPKDEGRTAFNNALLKRQRYGMVSTLAGDPIHVNLMAQQRRTRSKSHYCHVLPEGCPDCKRPEPGEV
jgi:hypothetical protein